MSKKRRPARTGHSNVLSRNRFISVKTEIPSPSHARSLKGRLFLVKDVDGNQFMDFTGGWGWLIWGMCLRCQCFLMLILHEKDTASCSSCIRPPP